MKDIYGVLFEKELELARVSKEVDALRFIVPLIEDGDNGQGDFGQESRLSEQ